MCTFTSRLVSHCADICIINLASFYRFSGSSTFLPWLLNVLVPLTDFKVLGHLPDMKPWVISFLWLAPRCFLICYVDEY